MSFFDRFKKKPKADELTPVKVVPLKFKDRLAQARLKKKDFEFEVAITYDDKPIRLIKINRQGRSRDQVAKDLQDKLSLKVVRGHEVKQRK